MENIKDLVWTEKYRPSTVENVVGDYATRVSRYLEKQNSIPNFLFHSKTPGTGKTTLAKAIINDLQCDFLILNASDDRKIETIREKVKDFSISMSSNGKRKCCFFDEFDGMLGDSQNALRNLMETYSNNLFFIMTCNNLQKVIAPIQSRCTVIEFTKPKKEDIFEYLKNICKNENLIFTEDGINKLIDKHYPSIRNCVLKLQDIHIMDKDVTPENIIGTNQNISEVWNLIKAQKYSEFKIKILEDNIDCSELNDYIFQKILVGEVPLKQEIELIPLLAKNERDFSLGADKTITFLASVISMIRIMRA